MTSVEKPENSGSNEQLLNSYYGGEDLRRQAEKSKLRPQSDDVSKLVEDWKRIRDEISKASNPPAMGIEKFGFSGMLGFVTSYADETCAALGASGAAWAAAEFTPQLLKADYANPLFYTMLCFQLGWIKAGLPPMREAWVDLQTSGVCTSPTAQSVYEVSKRIIETERFQRASNYTDELFQKVGENYPRSKRFCDIAREVTKPESLHRYATNTGYWFWNGVKEIPWWVAGGFATPLVLSRLSYDVDPKASMSVFLMGACVGSIAYQNAQIRIQRYLKTEDYQVLKSRVQNGYRETRSRVKELLQRKGRFTLS